VNRISPVESGKGGGFYIDYLLLTIYDLQLCD